MSFNSSISGIPITSGAAVIQTVFGRTGPHVIGQTGDYTAAMVGAEPSGSSNTSMVTHINELDPHIQYVLKVDLESYFDAAILYFDNNIIVT